MLTIGRRTASGLLVFAAIVAGCIGSEDGPAFLYRLQIRNDTDAVRLVVPLSGPRADRDSIAYVVKPGQEIWASSEPMAGTVTRGVIQVFDVGCTLLGQVELVKASSAGNDPIPSYRMVVNYDPTSVTVMSVDPPAANAAVGSRSTLGESCQARNLSSDIGRH